MQHHWIVSAQAFEVVERPAAGNEVVVGQGFEPRDAATVLAEQCFIVLGPQPEPESQMIDMGSGHRRRRRGGSARAAMSLQSDQLFAFALAASHSAFDISVTP